MNILVSVIIPVYNVEKYIAKTVNSVLKQTYQNFEVLIIDDESPDNSVAICQEFKDTRIKIISQKNRGLAGARNTGIREAKGEYIALLDSDDLWEPEKLAKQVNHLTNSPSVGVSFCSSAFIDEDDNYLGIYQIPQLTNITAKDIICRNPISNGSTPVIRKQVFEQLDYYFDEDFRESEDVECWVRIAVKTNWQIEGIPDCLTLYRVNTLGLSANLLKKQQSWEELLKKVANYAPELINDWGNSSRGYHLRYLARRAVSLRDGEMAVKLINQALATYWPMCQEEPRRTMITLVAAYLVYLLPSSVYQNGEAIAMNLIGKTQKLRIK